MATETRRIIQICYDAGDHRTAPTIIALSNEGLLFMSWLGQAGWSEWVELPDLPQPTIEGEI